MCVLASAVDIFSSTHREAVISEQLVTASLRFIPHLFSIVGMVPREVILFNFI